MTWILLLNSYFLDSYFKYLYILYYQEDVNKDYKREDMI